ncbi:MAG: hypothetical protein KGY99_08085 [Phycisphaerae bacterium]|nr:hypothetical protein [Phycisphaerae bacterium]
MRLRVSQLVRGGLIAAWLLAAGCGAMNDQRARWVGGKASDATTEAVPVAAQLPSVEDGLRTPDQRALNRAVALAAEGSYRAAAERLRPLTERFARTGDRRRAAEATYWSGYCAEKLGDADRAETLYHRVLRDYSEQPAARHAKRRLEVLQ